jgi:translation initiation factor 2B subunit (eIF-2B alpha/beta/delta family)
MINKKLETIIADNKSGSRDLLQKLNSYLSLQSPVKIKILIPILRNKFIEFNTIQNYLANLDTAYAKNQLNDYFRNQIASEKLLYTRIFENLPDHIKHSNNILTFSNSKTIFEIIKLLGEKNKKLSVTISESRPQFEGRELAKAISKLGIKINFISEAQLPNFVSQCDIVIIGADIILKSGNVINKVGSKSLAIICKHFKKPFYVIADNSKISNRKTFKQSSHPAREIWNTKRSNIKIENFYFEEIEAELITEVITD